MNRTRRTIGKNFVSGGVYNPNSTPIEQAPVVVELPVKPQPEVMPVPVMVKVEQEPVQQPEDESKMETGETSNNNEGDNLIGGKIPFKKIFQKRKKSSERTRDKKLRQNKQLRKSMLPKNALMALNEVKGVNISDFTINSNPDGGFTAIVTVNSVQYEGKGQSKMAAKNFACEKALRDYILAKMEPKPKKFKEDGNSEPMDTTDGDNADENGVPMLNLASFAIYKLFSEWEREGFKVPEMHPSGANGTSQQSDQSSGSSTSKAAPQEPKEPKKPPVRSELPINWETMHPATLLCVMRPGLSYVDHGSTGENPNIMQRLGIVVDNQEFTATGRSKKIARRNVAVNVCNSLFNTNFLYEEN